MLFESSADVHSLISTGESESISAAWAHWIKHAHHEDPRSCLTSPSGSASMPPERLYPDHHPLFSPILYGPIFHLPYGRFKLDFPDSTTEQPPPDLDQRPWEIQPLHSGPNQGGPQLSEGPGKSLASGIRSGDGERQGSGL